MTYHCQNNEIDYLYILSCLKVEFLDWASKCENVCSFDKEVKLIITLPMIL